MKLKLNNNKIILNPGSVGQPRNKTKNACWLLVNEKSMKMKFMETKYDNKKLINKITKFDQGNKRLLKYFK